MWSDSMIDYFCDVLTAYSFYDYYHKRTKQSEVKAFDLSPE